MLDNGNQATGGDGWMFLDVFEQAKKTGILTSADFGGFEWGDQFAGWASGYDKYYRAMKVRASEYYKIDVTVPGAEEVVKQWICDHGDQSAHGGLLAVQVSDATWATGTVNGRRVFTRIGGTGGHALTVCGYDDTFNGGSYLLCGNWGEGFYWAAYQLFKNGSGWYPDNSSAPFFNNKYFMGVRIKKNYSPRFTFKVTLTHNQRNQIYIQTGVANTTGATAPTTTTDYYALVNYTGGGYPLCGAGQSSTIELGLDLTDFAPVVSGGQGSFFLKVTSKGGTGQVNSLSLMDYSGPTVVPIACAQTNVGINGTITMKVPWSGTAVSESGNIGPAHQGNGMLAAYEPSTHSMRFTFPGHRAGSAVLQIRDVSGRMVLSRALPAIVSDGMAGCSWDLKDDRGGRVARGTYIASVNMTGDDGRPRSLAAKVLIGD
jgi:hypothetical protein